MVCVCVCVCVFVQVWHLASAKSPDLSVLKLHTSQAVSTVARLGGTTPASATAASVAVSVSWRQQPPSQLRTTAAGDGPPPNALMALDASGRITLWRESDPHEGHSFVKCAVLQGWVANPRQQRAATVAVASRGTTFEASTPSVLTPAAADPLSSAVVFVSTGWVGFVPVHPGGHWAWQAAAAPTAVPLRRGRAAVLRPRLSDVMAPVGHSRWAATASMPSTSGASRDWIMAMDANGVVRCCTGCCVRPQAWV